MIIADPGNPRTYRIIEDLTGLTRRAIRHGFFKLGQDLRAEASREILRRPKGGRVYYLRSRPGGRVRRHVASAPGETHANFTGRLRRSIGWQVYGHLSMEFGYGVDPRGPAPVYGQFLEFGTIRLDPRPSLQNAMEVQQRNGETYFNNEFNRAFP